MSAKPAGALLWVLAVLILGAIGALVWWLGSADAGSRGPGGTADWTRGAGPPSLGSAPQAALVPAAAEPESAETQAATEEARVAAEASLAASADELAEAIWVSGVVAFPPGTPPDERVTVTADGKAFESKVEDSDEVGPDGAFRVAFAKGTRTGHLRLRARYLYLEKSFKLDLREAPREVLLEPLLGGRAVARIVPDAAHVERAKAAAGELLSLYCASGEPIQQRRELVWRDGALEAAFDALAVGPSYSLSCWSQRIRIGFDGPFSVQPGATELLERVPDFGATIAGRVLPAPGAVLEGVRIGTLVESSRSRHSGSMEVAEDGTFYQVGFEPGVLTLTVTAKGHEPELVEVGRLAADEIRAGLEIQLRRGLSITGRVSWPDGRPAEGATLRAEVELEPGEDEDEVAGADPDDRPWTKSKEDGSFELLGLAARAYTIHAECKPQPGKGSDGKQQKRSEIAAWWAKVENARPGEAPLSIVLQEGMAVHGRVLDDQDAPLASFTLRVMPATQEWYDWSKQRQRKFANPDGSFYFDGLAAGDWGVEVEAKGYGPLQELMDRGGLHRVSLPLEGPLLLRVGRQTVFLGRVVDPTGRPARNSSISARTAAGDGTTWSGSQGADGGFEVSVGGVGTVLISASSNAWGASDAFETELAPGTTIQVGTLRLRRGATIRGRILPDTPGGVAGRAISVQRVLPEPAWKQTETNPTGEFEITGLSPGEYQVVAARDASGDTSHWTDQRWGAADPLNLVRLVTVGDGGEVSVELGGRPAPGIALSGRVTRAGVPVSGADLAALSQALPWPVSTVTAEDGSYALEVHGDGAHELSVAEPDYVDSRFTIVVHGATHADLELGAGSISGSVVDADGETVDGWMSMRCDSSAVATGPRTNDEWAQIASGGRYVFRGLADGTYELEVRPDDERRYSATTVAGLVIAAGASLDNVVVVVATPGTIRGRVDARDVDPGSPIVVRATRDAGRDRGSATADSSGTFAIEGLGPGEYQVRAFSLRGVSRPRSAVVASDSESEIDLNLEPAVWICARPAPGAADGLFHAASRDDGGSLSSADELPWMPSAELLPCGEAACTGRHLGPLLAGVHVVQAWNRAGWYGSAEVTVADEPLVVEVTLEPPPSGH